MIGLATQILAQAVPLLGVSSEPAQDILDAIKKLSKHVPPGSVSDADKKNQLQSMLLKQQQQAPLQAAAAAPPVNAADWRAVLAHATAQLATLDAASARPGRATSCARRCSAGASRPT